MGGSWQLIPPEMVKVLKSDFVKEQLDVAHSVTLAGGREYNLVGEN